MLAAALAGTGLRGRTWVLWGYREESLRRDVRCSNGEDVVRVDGNDPMVYIVVQTCDTTAPDDIAVRCAADVVTCLWEPNSCANSLCRKSESEQPLAGWQSDPTSRSILLLYPASAIDLC